MGRFNFYILSFHYRVLFHFKSSLLSNNGTNISSGQIPQLFYKVLLPEFFVVTNLENPLPSAVHILSRKFSHTVSEVSYIELFTRVCKRFLKILTFFAGRI